MAFAGTRTRGSACGCCEGTCIIVSDDFDRSDSSDLGSDYTTISGAIAISGNAAVCTTDNSLVLHDSTATVDSVSVEMTGTSGAEGRLIGSRGATSFVTAAIEFGSSSSTLNVYNGTSTLVNGPFVLTNVTAGQTVRVTLCWGYGTIGSIVGPTRVRITDAASGLFLFATGFISFVGDGSQGGIGTGSVSSGSVTFDNYQAVTTSDRRFSCPDCKCFCQQHDCTHMCVRFPDDLGGDDLGGLSGGAGQCSDLNGDQIATGGCTATLFSDYSVDCIDPLRTLCHFDKAFDFGDIFTSLIMLVVLHQGSSDNWYVTVILQYTYLTTLEWKMTWSANLGTDVPTCSRIECAAATPDATCVDDFANVPCDLDVTNISVSSGSTCCYYDYGGGTRCTTISPPEPTYSTVEKNGSTYASLLDIEMENVAPGGGAQWAMQSVDLTAGDGTTPLSAICSQDDDNVYFTFNLLNADGGDPVVVPLEIESESPFLATGSTIYGGNLYEVTVSE